MTKLENNRKRASSNTSYQGLAFVFILANCTKLFLFDNWISPRGTIQAVIFSILFIASTAGLTSVVLLGLRGRMSVLIVSVMYLFQLVYLLIYASYFSYFHQFFNLSIFFSLLTEGATAVGGAAAPIPQISWLMLADLPALLALLYFRIVRQLRPDRFPTKTIVVLLGIHFLLETILFFRDATPFQPGPDPTNRAANLVTYYGSFGSDLSLLSFGNFDSSRESSFAYGEVYSLKPRPQSDVIVVQVESLDSNVVSATHSGRLVAPFLNRLTRESLYFPNMVSHHFAGGTSDIEFTAINGIQPLEDYPAMKLPNYQFPNSFVRKLTQERRDSEIFHGNIGSFFNRSTAFPRMGFSRFWDQLAMKLPAQGWGASDGAVFGFVLDRVKAAPKTTLFYVITMSSHGPFTLVSSYYHNKQFDDIANVRVRDYFNSINYVDVELERFVGRIRAERPRAWVVIFGDHTPSIQEAEFSDSLFRDKNLVVECVPLWIVPPSGESIQPEVDSTLVSQLDLAPTILQALGVGGDYRSQGRSLLEPEHTSTSIPFRTARLPRVQASILLSKYK